MTEQGARCEDILRRMGRAGLPPELEAPDVERRLRIVGVINAQLAEQRREDALASRRLRLFAVVGAAAALLSGVGLFTLGERWPAAFGSGASVRALAGDVRIVRDGTEAGAARESSALAEADQIRTQEGARASARLGSGTTVTIEEWSELGLPAADTEHEELHLAQGRVVVDVPPLPEGRTLSVRTPSAVVAGRGTRFEVEVKRERQGQVTVVGVMQGSARVLGNGRRVLLTAGARWNSGADVAELPFASREAAAVPDEARDGAGSTLAQENQLYLEAMRAAREGDEAKE
jgi:hypothetical protein